MVIYRLFSFLIAVALLTGATESTRKATAAVPDACPMFQCRTVHAYWSGTTNLTIVAFFTVGGKDADTSTHGWENIFTPISTEKPPLVAAAPNVDMWLYDKCTPMCGKVNGKWQGQQEVVRGGKRFGDIVSPDKARSICTTNSGNRGPEFVGIPTNANVQSLNPPGVDTNGDPILGDPGSGGLGGP